MQTEMKMDIIFDIKPNGRIARNTLKAVARELSTKMKNGDYFITDTNGREECFTLHRCNRLSVSCEVVDGDELDFYNAIVIEMADGKWNFKSPFLYEFTKF